MATLIIAAMSFLGCFVAAPILKGLARTFGLYAIVEEGRYRVYVLAGRVVGVLDEPGLHLLWPKLGLAALFVNWLGRCHVVDMRLDQVYLRSQPVNSEEGAPMGIGIWYEMYVSDPVAYLFKNTDPRGSLSANVSNAAVRSLSNLKLADMLENRHAMSQSVRAEVTPKSHEWGYRLGSVYIRKVHFRDQGMIRQIQEKVVNRLRQVTASVTQDGVNQVSIIKSTAERQAAIEFAKAAAQRPMIVGEALERISEDPEIAESMFEVLETQKVLESHAHVTLLPPGGRDDQLAQLQLGSFSSTTPAPRPPPAPVPRRGSGGST
ncbi:MAG TPA: SPFH domain-containing protein [Myxococcaceae bacterium]|nr:SPFH domain-containing protein [Myxococcaceae bacterium]